MKALITGASSGMGKDMAKILAKEGHSLILVARNQKLLEELKSSLNCEIEIICIDISKEENYYKLYELTKEKNIDILINNAGCGVYGEFCKTDLKSELNMIDLNIKAVHILTKLFLKDFKIKNSGYILNVSSSAAFCAGPLFSSYYASKAYVLRLTEAIHEELKHENSNVYIGVFCPGPVKTNFDINAGISSGLKGISSEYAAKYALKYMFKKKMIIVPTLSMKFVKIFDKFAPETLILKSAYYMQSRKHN